MKCNFKSHSNILNHFLERIRRVVVPYNYINFMLIQSLTFILSYWKNWLFYQKLLRNLKQMTYERIYLIQVSRNGCCDSTVLRRNFVSRVSLKICVARTNINLVYENRKFIIFYWDLKMYSGKCWRKCFDLAEEIRFKFSCVLRW